MTPTTELDADTATRLRVSIGRLARGLNATVAGAGLTPTQRTVLGSVARQGPVRPADLAERENLNPTMLSRVVGKLDDAGLVTRLPDPQDRRAAQVEVTPAGRELQDQIRAERTRALTDGLDRLPDDLADSVLAALPALEALSHELTDR
ncbi:MAG TPA: MarR family transcriptional regulator [Mycobacteriales bacterium]|jgi:DNA-binding MarR family transcriptional regulator